MRAGMGSFNGKWQSCRPKRGDELVRSTSILCWSAGMASVLKVQSTVTEVLNCWSLWSCSCQSPVASFHHSQLALAAGI